MIKRSIMSMSNIMNQKERDMIRARLQPLDPEGRKLAEHKRFTLDMVGVPTDPLR